MDNGWIKLHRKILNNPIASKPNYLALWIHLLMMANHEDDHKFIWDGKTQTLNKGQFLTGRLSLSEISGIPPSTIEDILSFFEKEQQIRQQKTTKHRIITILNWENYQTSDNKATTKRQQSDTFKNTKKDKNTIEGQAPQEEIVKVIDSFKEINPAFKKWYGNTNQRKAITRMIETHTLEKILRVIAILPKTNKIPYITNIQTPCQLEDRWSTLEAQLTKEKAKLSTTNKNTPNYVL